jgi:hypothetical protein
MANSDGKNMDIPYRILCILTIENYCYTLILQISKLSLRRKRDRLNTTLRLGCTCSKALCGMLSATTVTCWTQRTASLVGDLGKPHTCLLETQAISSPGNGRADHTHAIQECFSLQNLTREEPPSTEGGW